MTTEPPDAVASGRTRSWRNPTWLGHSDRLPRRHLARASDSSGKATGRDASNATRATPRTLLGIAALVALMALGTAASTAGAVERHRSAGGVVDARGGLDPRSSGSVSGEGAAHTVRSKSLRSAVSSERVDLFGDSLGYQAEPYLAKFLAETNFTVTSYTYGGTATCDWLSRMAAAAVERPRAAILVFSGDAFTPCMEGVALQSPRYFALYTTYTEQAIAIFHAVSTHVFLVGTPINESSVAGWAHLDSIYRQLAMDDPLAVTYVNAAAAVETVTGHFARTLPCMSVEPTCGSSRTNVVRSPDGIHFCPDGTPATRGVTGSCDEYSSGAFRFAFAIASVVTS